MSDDTPREEAVAVARELMIEFAEATGLRPATGSPRRYLWTDAFAVCNFLGLYEEHHQEGFRHLALQLVDQVHNVLGHFRQDNERSGWLSGLDEKEGALHPTAGGLRIGKELRERRPDEPLDERLEWDRDGQYYHYLTKWMHALDRATRLTGDFRYNRWAIELAKRVHVGFIYTPFADGEKRMYWKMSTDLSRALLPSMGLHDPLDGLITYTQLQVTAGLDPIPAKTDLRSEIADLVAMCRGRNWASDDPLGIGGLLADAHRIGQLMTKGAFRGADLLSVVLEASLAGLESLAQEDTLRMPANRRLAFRELGLSIGLKAVERLSGLVRAKARTFGEQRDVRNLVEALKNYERLGPLIDGFWLDPQHRNVKSWTDHRDINMVMLATSLAPDGYLTLYTGSA